MNQFHEFSLATDAIGENGYFDPRYTCDLDNSSPELRWRDPPDGTAGFAILVEDPDAPSGLFVHWLIYNIAPSIRHLPAGVPPQELLPNGIRQGINSAGKLGYAGPCPPPGDAAHRYFFRIFALSRLPDLSSRATRSELLDAIGPHVVASAEFMGRYRRTVQKAG